MLYYDRESGCDDEGADALKKLKAMEENANLHFGHYEKVIKNATNFFFVPGEEPSGVPNALVVSQLEADGK